MADERASRRTERPSVGHLASRSAVTPLSSRVPTFQTLGGSPRRGRRPLRSDRGRPTRSRRRRASQRWWPSRGTGLRQRPVPPQAANSNTQSQFWVSQSTIGVTKKALLSPRSSVNPPGSAEPRWPNASVSCRHGYRLGYHGGYPRRDSSRCTRPDPAPNLSHVRSSG